MKIENLFCLPIDSNSNFRKAMKKLDDVIEENASHILGELNGEYVYQPIIRSLIDENGLRHEKMKINFDVDKNHEIRTSFVDISGDDG